jgi:hypothetical protein
MEHHMSLNLYLRGSSIDRCPYCGHAIQGDEMEFFDCDITSNLVPMFKEAGISNILWSETDTKVVEVLERLEAALVTMKDDPARFQKFDSSNGWGLYIHAVPWLERLVEACREHPRATLHSSW